MHFSYSTEIRMDWCWWAKEPVKESFPCERDFHRCDTRPSIEERKAGQMRGGSLGLCVGVASAQSSVETHSHFGFRGAPCKPQRPYFLILDSQSNGWPELWLTRLETRTKETNKFASRKSDQNFNCFSNAKWKWNLEEGKVGNPFKRHSL